MHTRKTAAKKVAKKRKTIIIPRKYVVAVDTGIKWLDLTFGRKEWLSRMDMSNFDIQNPSTCVAGNVFKEAWRNEDGYMEDGFITFENAMGKLGLREDAAMRFGFNAENDKAMQYLQDIWVRRINAMKKARK